MVDFLTGDADIYVDGNATPVASATGDFTEVAPPDTDSHSIRMGNYHPFHTTGFVGYLPEIIYYDRALTDEEREQVEDYLDCKYNVTGGC